MKTDLLRFKPLLYDLGRYTRRHSLNVAKLTREICRRMHKGHEFTRSLVEAALLHDYGKIDITHRIWRKHGKLNEVEWKVVKLHPELSISEIQRKERAKDLKISEEAKKTILSHHERVDGSGYAKGLRGEEIPPGAKILAVADAFDALTTDRPYREALPKELAIKTLMENNGYEKEIVNILKEILTERTDHQHSERNER